MPIVAEAYYQQISSYFEQHADVQLTTGQIYFVATTHWMFSIHPM